MGTSNYSQYMMQLCPEVEQQKAWPTLFRNQGKERLKIYPERRRESTRKGIPEKVESELNVNNDGD